MEMKSIKLTFTSAIIWFHLDLVSETLAPTLIKQCQCLYTYQINANRCHTHIRLETYQSYQLRGLAKIRKFLTHETIFSKSLINSIFTSRLDYCNNFFLENPHSNSIDFNCYKIWPQELSAGSRNPNTLPLVCIIYTGCL